MDADHPENIDDDIRLNLTDDELDFNKYLRKFDHQAEVVTKLADDICIFIVGEGIRQKFGFLVVDFTVLVTLIITKLGRLIKKVHGAKASQNFRESLMELLLDDSYFN